MSPEADKKGQGPERMASPQSTDRPRCALPARPCPWQLAPVAEARLTAKDPVKNASALLRMALPIDNKAIRVVQVGGGGVCGLGWWWVGGWVGGWGEGWGAREARQAGRQRHGGCCVLPSGSSG